MTSSGCPLHDFGEFGEVVWNQFRLFNRRAARGGLPPLTPVYRLATGAKRTQWRVFGKPRNAGDLCKGSDVRRRGLTPDAGPQAAKLLPRLVRMSD
jgi:hypothetical protein